MRYLHSLRTYLELKLSTLSKGKNVLMLSGCSWEAQTVAWMVLRFVLTTRVVEASSLALIVCK